MKWAFRKLSCKQLTDQLKPFRNIAIPHEGWLKTIRKLLGMTVEQLAIRSNVSRQRILQIEKDEVLKHLTMQTLEKVADNLNCTLVYALIPKKDLVTMINEQARKHIISKLENISHSMTLEDQKVKSDKQEEQIKILIEDLINNNIKDIWK